MDSPEKTSETKSNPEAEKVPDPPKKLGLQRRGVQSAKSIKQSVQSSSQVSVPYQRPSSANLGLYRDMLNHGCGNGDIDWMNALRSQSRGSSVTTFKRSQTAMAPFNLHESSKPFKHEKKQVVQFKTNGNPGEFWPFINHRVLEAPNECQLAFETNLRSYNAPKLKVLSRPDSGVGKTTQDAPPFTNLPLKERHQYPFYRITRKEMDTFKKLNPSIPKESVVLKEGSTNPKGLIEVTALDPRTNYPKYPEVEKPAIRNVEPFSGMMGTGAILSNVKWSAELRFNKQRKNYNLKPFRYRDLTKPDPKVMREKIEAFKKAGTTGA